MQEYRVTASGQTYEVPLPFLVFATQNPIEQEGTYPLPEAQLDRFVFKVYVGYPSRDEERQIYRRTTGSHEEKPAKVLEGSEIPQLQALVRRVPVSDHCVDYAMALVRSTRTVEPDEDQPAYIKKWISWGAGPRAGQSLIMAAKARAALEGRTSVTIDDIKAVARPVLRHRLVTTYSAQSEGQTPDTIIEALLRDVSARPGVNQLDGQVAQVFRS
jgi:MoxR-like ATPase